MTQLILGSKSPRRKEILNYFTVPFEQADPDFDEEAVPFTGDPAKYVQILSQGKAESLSKKYPEAILITADTVVYCEGKIYNKPQNKEEAFQAMSQLSGRWHSVFTAVTVRKGKTEHHAVEETRVLFHDLTPEQIRSYHHQLHCEDKAGGYAVQQAGAIVIKKIDGCFYNVMGLPINTLRILLEKFGIDLWNHLKCSTKNR